MQRNPATRHHGHSIRQEIADIYCSTYGSASKVLQADAPAGAVRRQSGISPTSLDEGQTTRAPRPTYNIWNQLLRPSQPRNASCLPHMLTSASSIQGRLRSVHRVIQCGHDRIIEAHSKGVLHAHKGKPVVITSIPSEGYSAPQQTAKHSCHGACLIDVIDNLDRCGTMCTRFVSWRLDMLFVCRLNRSGGRNTPGRDFEDPEYSVAVVIIADHIWYLTAGQ